MSLKLLYSVLLYTSLAMISLKCNDVCVDLIPDAITQLLNGTVVVFKDNIVWFWEKDKNELIGPCLIKDTFPGMDGPIDSAITFTDHNNVLEYVGASIYFGNGMFYTFKNLRQYQVDWGGLTYLPYNGQQSEMGSDDYSKSLMATTMSAAYFNRITKRVQMIFKNGSILGSDFELGMYFTPVISSLKTEYKKYNIRGGMTEITAALDILENKVNILFLFNGSNFCKVVLNDSSSDYQICDPKPISQFFGCKTVVIREGHCARPSGPDTKDKDKDKDKSNDINDKNPGVKEVQKFEATPGGEITSTVKSGVSSFNKLFELILNLLFVIFIKMFS